MLRYVEGFYLEWILNIVTCFFSIIEMIIQFSSFHLLMWCTALTDLQIMNHPCISGINPTLSSLLMIQQHILNKES